MTNSLYNRMLSGSEINHHDFAKTSITYQKKPFVQSEQGPPSYSIEAKNPKHNAKVY